MKNKYNTYDKNEIREKLGLCYHISSRITFMSDVSILSGYAGVNKNSNTIIEDIKKLLFSLKDRITDEMIENSKKYVNGISLMENETVDQINDLISIKEVNGIETTLEEDAEEVNKVTKQDIFDVIDKYVKEYPKLFNIVKLKSSKKYNKKSGKKLLF